MVAIYDACPAAEGIAATIEASEYTHCQQNDRAYDNDSDDSPIAEADSTLDWFLRR